jgi:diaminopimelate epimerase
VSTGVRVTKMSGAGNDFVVLGADSAAALGQRLIEWTRRVCRRGDSVGADGVLVVERTGADRIAVRFLNPDGSSAFCGNGSRCAARFAELERLAHSPMTLVTDWGEVPARVDGDRVALELPAPIDRGPIEVEALGREFRGRLVDAGVPHFVVPVDDVLSAPLDVWGPALRRHARFAPQGANVDLVDGVGASLRIRTFERGVEGETRACGSGAIATAFAHRLEGGPAVITLVPASGRTLTVELLGPAGGPRSAVLTGDARRIFDGIVSDEAVS